MDLHSKTRELPGWADASRGGETAAARREGRTLGWAEKRVFLEEDELAAILHTGAGLGPAQEHIFFGLVQKLADGPSWIGPPLRNTFLVSPCVASL